jgi:predicted metal-dependent hydrolase
MAQTIDRSTDEWAVASTHPGSDGVPMRPIGFQPALTDLPKYFAAGGDLVMSHVLAVLSSFFPDGEDYFVRSVTAVHDRITDRGLLADVDGFIGQESMHGMQHRELNTRLGELGYPTAEIGRYVRAVTGFREKIQGAKANVAFTAAIEHYTASLAETLLGDEAARAEIGHPGARHLLMWHALEEAEHKAVAFDVYRAIGGGERLRIVAMWITHVTFVLETAVWSAISIARDPEARRHPGRVVRGVWRLRRSPFTSKRAIGQLMSYHRRGFHPNDSDTVDMVAQWRQSLFGPDGELTGLLAY